MRDNLIAWVIIGAAASLVGMIYPFRRGTAGVLGSLASGIFGAVAVGLLGWLVVSGSAHHRGLWTLPLAAAGALAAIALLHVVYSWWATSRAHAAPPHPRPSRH